MSVMSERVAAAIIHTMFAEHELPVPDDIWDRYCETAKAAIEEMLEPTGEMLLAGRGCFFAARAYEVENAWRAMINEALK